MLARIVVKLLDPSSKKRGIWLCGLPGFQSVAKPLQPHLLKIGCQRFVEIEIAFDKSIHISIEVMAHWAGPVIATLFYDPNRFIGGMQEIRDCGFEDWFVSACHRIAPTNFSKR